MNNLLVDKAFSLFVETMPLETMELNDQTAHVWHDLYSKECQIFDCLRLMTEEERVEYRMRVEEKKMADFNREELQWEYMNGEYED